MRAAIYARRSTDEHQAASLEVQVEEATRYVQRRGWTLDPSHIYLEDAVSRAEFKKRPALIAMVNAVEQKAFDVIVCRDETRLGGDGPRTTLLIQDVIDAGGRLFYYVTDEEVELNDATAKFMVSVRNFAAELEREKIASRTREHLMTKARRGLNAGGRCYGYDNVEVRDGERRLRVEYAVNEAQAAVVRGIFERYAEGWGLKKIVKDLNARKVPSPSAGKRGTGSWSPSAVHALLRRERYRGTIVWGRFAKGYRKGTKVRTEQPETDWLRVEAPQLQIIDEELWYRAHARANQNKRESLGADPAGRRGRPAKYLLSGLARCGLCGGPIAANTGKYGSAAVKVYACQYHRTRGDEVCTASLRRPVEAVDRAVLDYLARNVLTEEVVTDALRVLRQRLIDRVRSARSDVHELEAESRRLREEIANLVKAIAAGGANAKLDAVVDGVAERQERLREVDSRIRAAKTAPDAIMVELRRMELEARGRLSEFRSALEAHPDEARTFLGQVLAGKLRFTPDGNRFRIDGEVPAGAGLFDRLPKYASPGGVELQISGARNLNRDAGLTIKRPESLPKLESLWCRSVPPHSA
jgi:site-specific DNA recombinase